MNKENIALSFMSRLGLKQMQDSKYVESIMQSLSALEQGLDESLIIATNSSYNSEENEALKTSAVHVSTGKLYKARKYSKVDQVSTEVDLLGHIMRLKNASLDDDEEIKHRGKEDIKCFLQARNLLIDAIASSAWLSYLDDVLQENDEIAWHGINRLTAALVIALAIEKYIRVKESTLFHLLVDHIIRGFRFSFQSETSELCLLHHPEWAISYMKSVIKKYHGVFKKMKSAIRNETDLLFESYFGTLESPQSKTYMGQFKDICNEIANFDLVGEWTVLIAKEVRVFVFSRLPLLMYDYYLIHVNHKESNKRLDLEALTGVLKKPHPNTHLHVAQSYFDDNIKTSVVYTLLQGMTDLWKLVATLDTSAREIFGDFDANTIIPSVKIEHGTNNEFEIVLDYSSDFIYGCLDALIKLERTHTLEIVQRIVDDAVILDAISGKVGINCPHVAFLQDEGYNGQIVKIVCDILSMFDARSNCLGSLKSKSEYAANVISPLLMFYINDMKNKWNSEESIFESSGIASFLLESATHLYEFLLKYPQSQHIQTNIASLEKILVRMVSIIDEYIKDLLVANFCNIHKEHLGVAKKLCTKLMQIGSQCSATTFVKILKSALDSVQQTLLRVLIPKRRQEIILLKPDHVATTLLNCGVLQQKLAPIVEPLNIADEMPIIELKTAAEYLDVLNDTERLFSDSVFSHGNPIIITTGDVISSSIVNRNVNLNLASTTSDSFVSGLLHDTLLQNNHELEAFPKATNGDEALIENVKHKLKAPQLLHDTQTLMKIPKTRTLEHIQGNYHTLCYIKVPVFKRLAQVAKSGFDILKQLTALTEAENGIESETHELDPYLSSQEQESQSKESIESPRAKNAPEYAHVSLSRPLYLKRQFIAPFLDMIKKELALVKPFYLIINDDIAICANEKYTRFFAVALLNQSCKETKVLPLIDIIDNVAESFGYEKYYSQRQPHISLVSTTMDIRSALERLYSDQYIPVVAPKGYPTSVHVIDKETLWPLVKKHIDACKDIQTNQGSAIQDESVEYTVSRELIEDLLQEGKDENAERKDNINPLCLYIDKINVLVGFMDYEIQLSMTPSIGFND
ncbi:U6 snRNA phosphodiesterase 1 [Babesia duncani]|uniref:U6 snRNA phosphodiesterase 1 n=1 Tax=Babesia duncani TaxID=323732 RepID=A0AAD9PN73_9APIC|nr:U6 snRNA phosphodiesterase 1 [Babesia duncani]